MRSWLTRSQRKSHPGDAPAHVASVLQLERATVIFDNLAAEHQTDPRALRLGGEERDEQIGRLADTRAVVLNQNFQSRTHLLPADPDSGRFVVSGGMLFQHRFDGIFRQIYQHLLDLRTVAGQREVGTSRHHNRWSVRFPFLRWSTGSSDSSSVSP